MPDTPIQTRADYLHYRAIPTRWMDNDVYGHVNNVVFYSYIDTLVNLYLVHEGGLDIHEGPVIGIVAESFCKFRKPIAYPDIVDGGLRVGRLGNSSVRYEIGLFRAGDEAAAAEGHFVHVFVDRTTRRPTPIPVGIRAALARLVTEGAVA